MLYYLGSLLDKWDIAGARLLHYVSFRAMIAFVLSLLITTWVGGAIIRSLRKHQIGETIRDLDLEGQLSK